MPTQLTGTGTGDGVTAGPAARMTPPPELPPPHVVPPHARAAEAESVRRALHDVACDLEARTSSASARTAVEVLTVQAMMARDPELARRTDALTAKGTDAAHAVTTALTEFREALETAGGYFADRALDLNDLRGRTIARLLGHPMPGLPDPGHPHVLVATSLAPADTALIDPTQVLALVTEDGGPTSHTAILARLLGLPAVVGCSGAARLRNGQPLLVDSGAGTVVADPPASAVDTTIARDRGRRPTGVARGPGSTADGHPVQLLVNLGAAGELHTAADTDSEGVGLLRTEFLYLDRARPPAVGEQTAIYREVFSAFNGRRVIIRTLDAGADKPLPFTATGREANPALGVRGLRTAARDPRLLHDQLSAIAAAARDTGADVWVMAPMVSVPAEAADFTEQVHEHGLPTAGAMIEVPAAALRAGQLAQNCDFLSIGTNDLAQYAFAADRTLGPMAAFLDPWQPALLDLVHMTARAGHAMGRPVSVCGEAAADPALAVVLTGLGVTSLSAAPNRLAAVRAALAAQSLDACRRLADLALAAPDAAAARAAVLGQLS